MSKLLCFIAVVILFAGCATEVEKSLDEYYPIQTARELVIDPIGKTDYFVGLEKIEIPLIAKAFDAKGGQLEVPEKLIHFTADGTTLTGDYLKITEEGTYRIVAHIGKLQSDTLTIRALDPSKLSLHLTVDPSQKDAFVADGKTALDFNIALYLNGEVVKLSSEFVLHCNNEPLTGKQFTTRKAGMYKFRASGSNLHSNEITVEALSPVKTLRLSKQFTGQNFFGYNISETGFTLEGLDAANQPVALSEDIKLYQGNNEIDRNTKFKSAAPGKVTFQAKGYKLESNSLELDIKSPVKTLTLDYTQFGNTFWADGTSEIAFSLKAFDFDGKQISPTADVKLYLGTEVIDYAKKFTTRKSGDLMFQAKGYNSESQALTIKAVAPINFRVVRIPVIFHEVNTTALTPEKINEIITGVNDAFRNRWNKTGGPKDPNSADLFVEIYPVDRDPFGNILPVKGLHRVRSGKESFHVDNKKRINEAVDDAWNYFWNPEQYYNIWVYPNITGDFSGASWAYYPHVTQQLEGVWQAQRGGEIGFTYGAFLNARHLGVGDGVEVTAHEIGHSLALAHVFDGDLDTHNGCGKSDPDYCADTQPYDRQAYEDNIQAEGYTRKSCSGQFFTATNFMDYYFGHENSFTVDQRYRVRFTIDHALWLPTPFNNFNNGRKANNPFVKKPANYKYQIPVACSYPVY